MAVGLFPIEASCGRRKEAVQYFHIVFAGVWALHPRLSIAYTPERTERPPAATVECC